jgi:hypothetical protein
LGSWSESGSQEHDITFRGFKVLAAVDKEGGSCDGVRVRKIDNSLSNVVWCGGFAKGGLTVRSLEALLCLVA